MSFSYTRRYAGPIRAVVLDWAGTAVDHGCVAPVGVFVDAFRERGVDVTLAEAREPMGTHKRDHIARMCAMPALRARWVAANGVAPSEADIDAMYAAIEPLALAILPRFAAPIPGLIDAIAALRARGIKIASTSGYNRAMLDTLAAASAPLGYAPDARVAASEVPAGRPAPFLAWEAAARVGVWPAAATVHVGDTVVDIEAGLNAGMWSVGVAASGNEVGLDADAFAALDAADRAERVGRAREKLARAGAHAVLDSVAGLPALVGQIEAWIRDGRQP